MCSLLIVLLISLATIADARVTLGIDNLLLHQRNLVAGKKIGVVTNHTGYTSDGTRTVDALRSITGVTLVAIFAPEHGLSGTVGAGKTVAQEIDSATGAPVFSLYGALRKPKKEMLRGIDVLVYDIQDIGIRSYTFIGTLGMVMQAAAESHVHVVVLDRPGLLADRIDGNVLDTAYRSFVGKYPIPYVYGLTPGELAAMINNEGMLGVRCALTVVPMDGWHRGMPWDSTGLVWRATSPNIPSPSTAMYCAAFGAIGELGAGYQGIGSSNAFRVFGGAKFPARSVDSAVRALHLAGVRTSLFDTVIISSTGATVPMACIRFELRRDSVMDLFAVGLEMLSLLQRMHLLKPADDAHVAMFNKVCGASLHARIIAGVAVSTLQQEWREARAFYKQRRALYLRYR